MMTMQDLLQKHPVNKSLMGSMCVYAGRKKMTYLQLNEIILLRIIREKAVELSIEQCRQTTLDTLVRQNM